MKRVIIGGFLLLVGGIWGIGIVSFAADHLVSSWSTPPGRLLTTIFETDMTFPAFLSLLFLVIGLIIFAVEYFKPDK